jgi:serine/threonine-protein kinase
MYLQAIPAQKETTSVQTTAPDWSALFSAADLDQSKLQPAQPQWTSLGATDARAAWTGVWPGTTRLLRVEAAAWHGKPVFFALIGDWNKPWRMVAPRSADDRKDRASQMIGLLFAIALLVASALVARRNYRLGRADREGAFRLAVVMFVLEILLYLCRTHFVAGSDTFGVVMLAIGNALLISALVWILYLAIEPWIRRRWPHAIISWSRLISGQLRDPLLGRDILFGVTFGAIWILIFEISYIPLERIGAAPTLGSAAYLLGGRHALAQWLIQIPISIISTLEFFFLLLGLKVLLRKDWIAAIAFVVFFVGMRSLQSTHPAVDVPTVLLVYGVLVLIVFRFGLVPLAVGAFTVDMLANVPFTADFSEWYVGWTLLALLSVVALAAWGFYHSLGGEPLWKIEME